jgi:hypothetical protein
VDEVTSDDPGGRVIEIETYALTITWLYVSCVPVLSFVQLNHHLMKWPKQETKKKYPNNNPKHLCEKM